MTDESIDIQQHYDTALAELPAKRRQFVIEYMKDLNGKRAAIRAGYSEETAEVQASQLLRILKVREAVSAGMALKAMTPSEVLARLADQARSDMGDFLRVDEEEITLTWSLISAPLDDEGKVDVSGLTIDLAMQDNVQPTDRVLQTATVKRSVARLDLLRSPDKLHLIKKYSLDEKGKVSIELYDAHSALVDIGRAHGMFVDKKELTGKDGEPLFKVYEGIDPDKV